MKLTINQEKAINEIDNHLQIVACAGSGKTEVITRRIANILDKKTDVDPSEIVAFTFTEKAAESMKKRILKVLTEKDDCKYSQEEIEEKMYIGTIHGFCYKLLKEYVPELSNFSVLDSVKNYLFVERYFDICGASKLDLKFNRFEIKLFMDCIEKLISDYENYDFWDESDKNVFNTYREFLYSKKYLDFSSIIFETIKQISVNEEIRKCISKIKYLVVDEYQDVDDMQEKLVGLFYKNGANICVVGDDDQTIYRFRGSNAENMIRFSERYSNVVQVKLEDNFRCAEGIIDVANEVVKNNENRIIKKMIANKASKTSIVVSEEYSTIWEQYEGIARNIQKLKQEGHQYSEIAVLVRKGKFIVDIVECLEELGIPYVTNNAEHFFKGKYFERFIMTLNNLSNINKKYLYDWWKDVIDVEYFNKGFRYLRKISNSGGNGKQLPLSKVIENFLNELDFFNEKYEDIQDRKDALKGISDIFRDFDEIYKDYQLTSRVNKLIMFLEDEAAEQYKYHNFKEKVEEDAVQIMTVHKSKGLEFNTVFIPRVEHNEFPSRKMGGKKYWHVLGECFQENREKFETDLEDERKLFYVAVTRAKQNLFLMHSLESKESQFIVEAKNSKYLVQK